MAENIFQFLPFPDLLNCSLVSRVWNINARTALRSSKQCLLSVSLEEDFYGNFHHLIATLDDMRQSPFCGMSVTFPRNPPSRLYESAIMIRCWDRLIHTFTGKFDCKYFRVNSGTARKKIETRAIEKLLAVIGYQLEGVELVGDPPCTSGLLSKGPVEGLWNLGQLKFDSEINSRETYQWSIEVMAHCPNLRKINGFLTEDWFKSSLIAGHVLRNEFIVKEFDSSVNIMRLLHDMGDYILRKMELEKLRFSYLQNQTRNRSPSHRLGVGAAAFRRLEESLRMQILRGNCKFLKELTIVHKDLVRLSSNFPVCPQLSSLMLYVYEEEARDPKYLLRGINFSVRFPSLERIQVNITYGSAEDRIPGGNQMDDFYHYNRPDDIAHSVKTILISSNISLEGGRSTASLIFRFSKLCPNVRHFVADRHKASSPVHFIPALWVAWSQLETITLSLSNLSGLKQSLDAVCCGISEDEAELLRTIQGNLTDLHVVPIAPSIQNKKGNLEYEYLGVSSLICVLLTIYSIAQISVC